MSSTTQDNSEAFYEEFPPLTTGSTTLLARIVDNLGLTCINQQDTRRIVSAGLRGALTLVDMENEDYSLTVFHTLANNLHNPSPSPSQMHQLLQELIYGDAAISVNNSVAQDKLRILQRGLAHHLPA